MSIVRICEKHNIEKRKIGKTTKFRCHMCHSEKAKERYFEKNKEKILNKIKLSPEERKEKKRKSDNEYKKKQYCKNKEIFSERAKKYYHKNKQKRLNFRLMKGYGITLDEYSLMCLNQKNKCLICDKEEVVFSNYTKTIKRLSVDHCHTTKKVRGLLCSKCNCVIGYANESIDILRKAIDYLKGHSS